MCIRDRYQRRVRGPSVTRRMSRVQVTYPQGIAWRKSPSYNDRIINVPGPVQMSELQGQIVQGDVAYLQVTMPPGTPFQFQFVPLKAPNGQELARVLGAMPQQRPPPPPMQAPPMQQMPMQPVQVVQMPVQVVPAQTFEFEFTLYDFDDRDRLKHKVPITGLYFSGPPFDP
eukprot:TRINITY_DN1703_c0_g1_i1.p1 TRINITY_DN1703_c0_g1~~TRINITY_DN1703_c0_g1_i1.p1  ORF type:complete len:171 (-),score=26.37 TRINITY_DN1703_c0_g1_i1:519-1031(-)